MKKIIIFIISNKHLESNLQSQPSRITHKYPPHWISTFKIKNNSLTETKTLTYTTKNKFGNKVHYLKNLSFLMRYNKVHYLGQQRNTQI